MYIKHSDYMKQSISHQIDKIVKRIDDKFFNNWLEDIAKALEISPNASPQTILKEIHNLKTNTAYLELENTNLRESFDQLVKIATKLNESVLDNYHNFIAKNEHSKDKLDGFSRELYHLLEKLQSKNFNESIKNTKRCTKCRGSGIVAGPQEYEIANCDECVNGIVVDLKPDKEVKNTDSDLVRELNSLKQNLSETKDVLLKLIASLTRLI